MFVFSIILTFILSCTLAILLYTLRNIRISLNPLWEYHSIVTSLYRDKLNVYNDENLALDEKYKQIIGL